MDIEKEIKAIKKRLNKLEIRADDQDKKSSRTESLLEQLIGISHTQIKHAESLNKSLEEFKGEVMLRFEAVNNRLDIMDNRIDKMDSRFDKMDSRLKSVEKEIINLVDYLKNPPKNGHP